MRGLLLVAAALTTVLPGGCVAVRKPWPPVATSESPALLARADALARNRSFHEARALYRRVLRTSRGTSAAADALYGLGQVYADPESPLHDWASASVAFNRLVTEYPGSRHVPEARAWRAALAELLKNQADARRLRADMERLKELDMEEEQDE